jgi:hypothetical protein
LMQNDETKEGGVIGDITDIHFTTLCFTSGTGAPVMCEVILKSEKELEKIPFNMKLWIDILKNKNTREFKSIVELLEDNNDDCGAMCGPICQYNGVEIPCFVCCTKKESITSELLVEMLKTIDGYKLFDHSDGSLPFLLLEGHQSWTQLPFLN